MKFESNKVHIHNKKKTKVKMVISKEGSQCFVLCGINRLTESIKNAIHLKCLLTRFVSFIKRRNGAQ